jgi:hypothetical protein
MGRGVGAAPLPLKAIIRGEGEDIRERWLVVGRYEPAGFGLDDLGGAVRVDRDHG